MSPSHAAPPPSPHPETSREVPGALAWSLTTKVLVSLLAIASNILIVRRLGDEAYGIYSIYLNIARFLALAMGLGMAQGVLQFLPELRVRRDGSSARRLLARALGLQFFGWLVIGALVLLLRGWLSGLVTHEAQAAHVLTRILLPGTLLLVCETAWTIVSHVFLALRRMIWLTIASVVQKAVLIGLLLLLVHTGEDLIEVLVAVAGSFLIGLFLLGPALRGCFSWGSGGAGEGLPWGRHLRYTLPIALGALINQILWRSSETLVLGHYHPSAVAGYYNAAYNLPQLILEFVPLAIWPIILASLSEVHTRRQADLLRGIRLYFRLIFVLVVPLAMTGLVLGGQLYQVMYGAPMAPGAGPCQALFGVFLLSFFATPLRMALFVKERAVVNTLILLIGATINVALDFLWIPRAGLWGGVVAVAVALTATGVLQYAVTRRILPAVRVPWGHFLRVLAASAIVLPLWPLRAQIERPVPILLALAGATLAQFFLLRALRVFGAEERELIARSNLPLKRWLIALLGGSGARGA